MTRHRWTLIAPLVVGIAVAPAAEAGYQDLAKFKLLSATATFSSSSTLNDPPYCTGTDTSRVSLRTVSRTVVYVGTRKVHGDLQTLWGTTPKPARLAQLELDAMADVSESGSYEGSQCSGPESQWSCDASSIPAELQMWGTEDPQGGIYSTIPDLGFPSNAPPGCTYWRGPAEAHPGIGLIPRADLFNEKLKRLKDSDRFETPIEDPSGELSGTASEEGSVVLKRLKLKDE